MPMTATVAPEFSRRHPRAAVIFDNLHMMHDIISDVLASPDVPASRKREVIYQQLAEFRSPTSHVISLEEWRGMADHMGGLSAMGGPATGLLAPAAPADTAPAVGHQHEMMPGMDMPGMDMGPPRPDTVAAPPAVHHHE
jgi:hypothetical protein